MMAKSESLTSCEDNEDVDTNMRDVSANHRHNSMEQDEHYGKDNGNSLLQSSDEFVKQQQQQQKQLAATLLSPFNLKTEPELQRELEDEEAEEEEKQEQKQQQQQQELALYEHFSNASAKDVCLKLQDQNGELNINLRNKR